MTVRFRHLDYPEGCPVSGLGAAALEALLDRGDLEDWMPLATTIRSDAFGELSETVLRLCAVQPMYGTSAMWTAWIERLRGQVPADRGSLPEIRRARGLTQEQVADRMGSRQSDVSKLERRRDIRVSTLLSYLTALGGEPAITVGFEEGETVVRYLLDEVR